MFFNTILIPVLYTLVAPYRPLEHWKGDEKKNLGCPKKYEPK
jgi:hypothetical protein